MCAQGRPEETEYGIRFFAGEVADAYLQRAKIQRGYTVVVWRGRHVAEPTELSAEEAAQYWLEVLEAGRRLELHLQPVKLNYDLLGNSLPHLHTHVDPALRGRPEARLAVPVSRGRARPDRRGRASRRCGGARRAPQPLAQRGLKAFNGGFGPPATLGA